MRKKLKVFDTKNRLEITVLPDWFFLCSGLLKGHGHGNGIIYKEQILIVEIHFGCFVF